VVLTDPHYACYPNLVRAVGGRPGTVPPRAPEGFQPRLADFEAAVDERTRALLLNSPANHTGAVMDGDTLASLVGLADANDATVVADEVYHGLSYGVEEHTVLEYTVRRVRPRRLLEAVRDDGLAARLDGRSALETSPDRLEAIRETYRERPSTRQTHTRIVTDWSHGTIR